MNKEENKTHVVSFPVEFSKLLNPSMKICVSQTLVDKLKQMCIENDLELIEHTSNSKFDSLYTLTQFYKDFPTQIKNKESEDKFDIVVYDDILKSSSISYDELVQTTALIVEREGLYLDNKNILWQRQKGVLKEFENDLNRIIGHYYVEKNYCKANTRNQILEQLKQTAYERYLKVPKFEHDRNYIYFLDKKLNWKTGILSDREKDEICFIQIPHKIGKSTNTSILDKVLNTLSCGEVEKFKDMIVYQALPFNPEKAINWWLGVRDTGKSTFESVISSFVGEDNIGVANFKLLIDERQRFELYSLRNKLVCFVSETEKGVYSTNTLKRISGNDDLSGEKKGINGKISIKSTATLNILTNDLPDILNKEDEAFTSRCLIYDFKRQFERVLNAKITEIPKEEYENLCLYLVQRVQEWVENNKVSLHGVTSIIDRHKEYLQRADPLAFVLHDEFEYCEDSFVYSEDVYNSINNKLIAQGKPELGWNDLGRKLKNTFKTLGWECRKDRKQEDGQRKWVFYNIRHKEIVPLYKETKSGQDSGQDKKPSFLVEKTQSGQDTSLLEQNSIQCSVLASRGNILSTDLLKTLIVNPSVTFSSSNKGGTSCPPSCPLEKPKYTSKSNEVVMYLVEHDEVLRSVLIREYGEELIQYMLNKGILRYAPNNKLALNIDLSPKGAVNE